MTRRLTITAGILFFAIWLLPTNEANALRPGRRGRMPLSSSQFGIRGGYDFEIDVWSLGGQLRFPMGPGGTIQIVPSGDLFLVDGDRDWQINLDAALHGRGSIYYGGGVAFANRDFLGNGEDDFKTGYNLFLGMKMRLRNSLLQPYLESRWTFIEEDTLFRLVVGFNLRFGG